MKAKRFLAFVAGAAMLFGAVGCTPDEDADDLEKAAISVSPTQAVFDLTGGDVTLEVTSNATWTVKASADVSISPTSGNGNGTVTIEVPASEAGRNIFVSFSATRVGSIGGMSYTTSAAADVVLFQNEKGEAKYATNVKAVRAALKAGTIPSASSEDAAAVVSDEVKAMTLTAVVVGEPDGNMSNNKLLAVQDNSTEPESGLTLYCENANDMAKGQVVYVSLASAKVAKYGEVIQLYTSAVTPVGTPIEVVPVEVTLANILDYESQYVKVNNLHPDPSAIGKSFADAATNKNVSFFDANYEEVIIRLSNYASFKDDIVPAKEGSVCGVASRYNNTLQLLPQYASDFELTNDFVFDTQVVTIAEIVKPGLYKVENAWVVGFTGNGVILTDSSNAFVNVYFNSNTHKTIGEKMTVEGVANNHQGGFQFDSPKATVLDGVAEVAYPTATDYTEAATVEALAAKFGGEDAPYLAEYGEFSGVVSYDAQGGYYNFLFAGVDANVVKGSLTKTPNEALNLQALDGKAVKLHGFVTDYGSPYLSITPVAVELDSSVVSLSAENVQLISPDGVENATTKIVSTGLVNGDITATCDGTVVTNASVDVEKGLLTYTVSANEGVAREGSVTLSVAGMADVEVKFSQLGTDTPVSTIAEVWEGTTGANYIVLGAQAVAVANNYVVLTDNSGKLISLYKPSVTPAIGDYVSVSGATSVYQKLFQFSSATVVVTGHSDTLIAPELQTLAGADADALLSVNAPQYIEYIGILTVSGSYYNVEIPGASTAIGSLKASNNVSADVIKSYANKSIKVKGYYYGVSSSKFINTSVESIEDDTTIKMLKADDISGVAADGVIDATLSFVAANIGAVTATCDGTVVTSASVDGNVVTYTVSANTTDAVRSGSITLSADGVEPVTITVSQLVSDNSTYTKIGAIADLTAGVYYMAAYCESYNSYNFEANPYHLCTGAKITTANSNADLYTTPYSYSDEGKLSPISGAENYAKSVTLVAVDGKENTYYVMLDGMYVYSYTANTNRRISLTDTPTEWVASDHSAGGVVLSSNQVNLGSAGAQSDIIRSYKDGSTSLKYGLYFFKKN